MAANVKKTKSLLIGSRHAIKKVGKLDVRLSDESVEQVDSFDYLGLHVSNCRGTHILQDCVEEHIQDLRLYSKSSLTLQLKEWTLFLHKCILLLIESPVTLVKFSTALTLQLFKNSTHPKGKLKFGVKCERKVYLP